MDNAPDARSEEPEEPVETGARAGAEDERLDILRALERGDITVAEATDRLSQLDEVLR